MDHDVTDSGPNHAPTVSGIEEMRAFGSIDYHAPASPHRFYTALVAARSKPGAAQDAVRAFIAGEAPYGDSFVANFEQLSAPISDFPKIAARYRQPVSDTVAWRDGLREAIRTLLAEHGLDAGYFTDPAYLGDVDRLWLSYFALLALSGYHPKLLADIALALWLAHAIAAMVAPSSGSATPPALTPGQLLSLMTAIIILPAEIFPLAPTE